MIISALRGQSCPIPLELELQAVVSRRTWVLGLQLKSLQGQCILLTAEPSSPYVIILITLSPAHVCFPPIPINTCSSLPVLFPRFMIFGFVL